MTAVNVRGYWKRVDHLTFRQLRDLLDVTEADLRAAGATDFFIHGVDSEDGTIFLQGTRPKTAGELAAEERIRIQFRDKTVAQYVEYIEQTTGKEVKLV